MEWDTEDILAKVATDSAYLNAHKNSDKDDAASSMTRPWRV